MVSYFLAVSLLHLDFSLLLMDAPLPDLLGDTRLIDLVDPVLLVLLGLLIATVLYQIARYPWRWRLLFFWGIWIVSVLLVDRFFLFKSVEYIHYPQYAVLAALLIWRLDPELKRLQVGRILFWATVLGIFDELNQYAYLARSYGDYLDFNDFFLNLQGAAAGVFLVYGFAGTSSERRANVPVKELISLRRVALGIRGSIEIRFLLMALAIALLLGVSGSVRLSPQTVLPPGGIGSVDGKTVFYLERKPGIMGTWNGGVHRPQYYVLTPVEGGLLLAAGWLGFSSFGVAGRRGDTYNPERRKT